MTKFFRNQAVLLLSSIVAVSLQACSGTPTRHLVSDVAMVKAGVTSREEVLTLMGDPDAKRRIDNATEEWTYYEEERATLQGTPLFGDMFDPKGYNMVLITLDGELVKTCNYRSHNKDEFEWRNDYSWQEIKK